MVVPDAPDLEFSQTQSYSLTVWVYIPSLPGTSEAVVEKSRDVGNWYGFWISPSNQWIAGTQNSPLMVRTSLRDGAKLPWSRMDQRGRWYFMSTEFKWLTGQPSRLMGQGRYGWVVTRLAEDFTGSLDDVRIYNTALSASQVTNLVTAGPPTVSPASPAPAATNVALASTVSATFSEAVQASTIDFT